MNYELLDSGNGRKLERVGDIVVDRQSPAAVWNKRLGPMEWEAATGKHIRSERGGGHWQWTGPAPAPWSLEHGQLTLEIKPTPFGHMGFFPEQVNQWEWVSRVTQDWLSEEKPLKLLNLFAYTGGSSLQAAHGGADVTHVDAARGIVDWARKNADLNGLSEAPIRWIVDDCARFVAREVKRQKRYDAIILDPPSFGRGNRGEIWKIEEALIPLLEDLARLTDGRPKLMLLTCHSPGFTPLTLANLMSSCFDLEAEHIESGEMWVPEGNDRRPLPAGFFARISQNPKD